MIIIDGHNLLHSIHKVEEDSEVISDVGLSRIIGRYLKLTGQKGEIIFDGTGPRDKVVFDRIDGVEILFAGMGTDTDTVIEEKIKDAKKRGSKKRGWVKFIAWLYVAPYPRCGCGDCCAVNV